MPVRSRLMQSRTALVNQIRGLLQEFGVVFSRQISQLRRGLPLILADTENELSEQARALFAGLYEELEAVDRRIAEQDKQLLAIHKTSELCQRLGEVEGIGPLTATAFMSAPGTFSLFMAFSTISSRSGRIIAITFLNCMPASFFQEKTITSFTSRVLSFFSQILLYQFLLLHIAF